MQIIAYYQITEALLILIWYACSIESNDPDYFIKYQNLI